MVLDVGGNAGFFSFCIAGKAKNVLGVDFDSKQIEICLEKARANNIRNVRFLVKVLTPETIDRLPSADVCLFLSVLHHMMSASGVYDCNAKDSRGVENAINLLKAIRNKTQVLFFEMGQSNENHEWANKLPDMGREPEKWILENLLRPAGFSRIKVISPPEWNGLIGKMRKSIHSSGLVDVIDREMILFRFIRRILSYDARDCRYLFKAE